MSILFEQRTNAEDQPNFYKQADGLLKFEVLKIATGFKFTEGPVSDGKGSVYFTDIPNNRIMRIDASNNVSVFMENSGSCNGLAIDSKGEMIACRMDGELIGIDLASKSVRVLAKEYLSTRFNACNDLVIDQSGGIYFTDPRYKAPEPWPQTVEAFYYRSESGVVSRLGSDLLAPNGIVLSPDEKTIYVVPSLQKELIAFDVESPGVLKNRRVFCELRQKDSSGNKGGDGCAVDKEGNLYVTTDIGIQVYSPRTQSVGNTATNYLGLIELPEIPANCGFGGSDGKTLYATCRTSLYTIRVPIAGHKFPGAIK
ncbi:MAG: SMP-30/gluconolactonase/LRE family protein [Planctomycetota bacterium]|nr:SMP-30/gluconolactonase/LRE family protein [Planctomycetota bacterium]